ncbi:hypothetical protein [Arthrobacter sp. NPDC058192]|uniref:hypothetical protein n=1 Tax=Arthrobacter sp. NPDC058192 TaxID=3346372 RepID=UPI0036E74DD4
MVLMPRAPAPGPGPTRGQGPRAQGGEPRAQGLGQCELYSPGALFSWPELQAMAADGVLTQLYQRGYLPPGAPASPQLRARAAALAVAPAIRQRVVAGRMTAAWIYGCAAEPDRLALLVDANRRISSLRSVRGCTFHEVRLGPFDVVSMGGLMVTSPLRTALDVALHVEAERAAPVLSAFLARPELGVRLRLLRLAIEASPRVPHRRAALAKLSALAPPLNELPPEGPPVEPSPKERSPDNPSS